jgi:hypothetical protein
MEAAVMTRPNPNLSDRSTPPKAPAAHEFPWRPKFTASRLDTRPHRLRRVETAYRLACDHLAWLLPAGRADRLLDALVQLDAQDGDRLVCLWRIPPTKAQQAAITCAWNGLTGAPPEAVSHLVEFPAAVGDPS